MKTRTSLSLLTVVTALAGFCAMSTPVQAQEDYFRCGTPYPGWWRHILGPKRLTDMIQISELTISNLPTAANVYDVGVTLVNQGKNPTPDRMPVALSFSLCDGSVMPNPDDPFNPNSPGNPYAVIQFGALDKMILPALKPGEQFKLSGRVSLQGRGAKIVTMSFGYDDWDWCGTKPRPWPGGP